MTFDGAWEVFSKVFLPIIFMYSAYLHRELSTAMQKIELIQTLIFEHRTEALKNFVTQEAVSNLETKLGRMLERIDDKITRVLEERK